MFKGKSKQSGKKKIAFLLSATTLLSTVFVGWQRFDNPDVYAGPADEEKTYYFAEGFGTGVDFSEDNWKINTAFRSGTPESITSNPVKYAAIVENEHSGNNEKIIRLINGVRGADLGRTDTDYRVGTALVKDRVSLKESSEFSTKFTISMPDACVNMAQTGGAQFAREVGGDGIAFIITPTDSINGQAGAGMGYYGVPDSLVIEMDSYFNGAYCTFESSGTAYVNWAYDNQIYANTGLGYLQAVADDTRNKGLEYDWANAGANYWTYLKNQGYEQLPASQDRRFDHVGVMLDGVTRDHIGISYLNGLQPDLVQGGNYVNINDPSASTPSSSKDCTTRFADAGNIDVTGEEVDNRLFTFWIEYDGENLYVRYANGNFSEAVRPADAQIKLEGMSQLAHKFANDDVQIGFTSSIGSSKANHTVHSVAFANKYFENGIQTEYTEKYYVENPDATKDFITVNSKKYVLTDSVVVENVDIASEAEIRDKSSETKYQPYIKKDYSDNPLYPDSTTAVKGDGTTVLYQFYDLPSYKVEYYLEQDAGTAGAVQVGDKYYVKEEALIKTAAGGSSVASNENANKKAGVTVNGTAAEDTYKSYMDYEFNPGATRTAGHSEGTVAKDNSLVIQLYYDKKTPERTEYKEQYWVEDPEADHDFVEIEVNGEVKKFVLKETNDVTDVNIGIGVTVTDKSEDYENYELVEVEIPGYPSFVDQINPDGTTIVHQIYVLKPTYQIEYWVEVPEATNDSIEADGKYYVIKSEETMNKYASAGTGILSSENTKGAGVKADDVDVEDTFKQFAGYVFNQTATDAHGKNSGDVAPDSSLVIRLLYDLEEKPVEPTTPEEVTTPEETTTPEEITTTEKPSTPEVTTPEPTTKKEPEPTKTGDSMNMTFVMLLLLSGCTVFVVIISKRKYND